MKKVKILHCADIHLDSPFKELNKTISLKSKEELLETFKKVIYLVLLEKIEILLIAGDFFDNMSLSKTTINFIMNEFSRIKDTFIFISPGNHDPYNRKSFYKILTWPDNVYIFKGPMESVIIEKLNVIVWGCGFNEKYHKKTLLKNIKVNKQYINIVVMHGQVSSGNIANEYNPIYLEDMKNSGANYIALGHEHDFSDILKVGETHYCYCGCLSGRGFDEKGPKGVVLGNVYENSVDLKFVPLSKRKYIVKEIFLKNISTYEDIKKQILSSIKENERKQNIYKIILKGYVAEYFIINDSILYEKLENEFYYIKLENKTNVEINLSEGSKDYSLKGKYILAVLEKLNQCTDDYEKEIVSLALKLGIQCFTDEEVTVDDN